MIRVAALALASLGLASGVAALAQDSAASPEHAVAAAKVSFLFDRPGLQVPHFTLTIAEDGAAHYEAEEVLPMRGNPEGVTPPSHPVDRSVILSQTTTRRIFTVTRALKRFNVDCASPAKNIADTGAKTLRYVGMDGEGACSYNYSQNKQIVQLTDLFQGIAHTLDMGRRLDFQHRFDRLGLDATISALTDDLDSGRAMEIGVIAPTLGSLAKDPEVLQRVRERAARLLQVLPPS